MDKQTIEQLEGVATLDRSHHDTTNATKRRCCQISWQNWAIIGLLVFLIAGGGEGLRLSNEVDRLTAANEQLHTSEIQHLKNKLTEERKKKHSLMAWFYDDALRLSARGIKPMDLSPEWLAEVVERCTKDNKPNLYKYLTGKELVTKE